MHKDLVALWGSIVVSVLVIAGFTAVAVLLFTKAIPTESKEIALLLFGGLNSMASGVVGYWVGSSVGSSRKDATISKLTGAP
jgi:uncharacterized membrane protein